LAIEALAGPAAAKDGPTGAAEVEVPPLLKGYLKAGARVLGEPHVDPQFGCADFPIMLEVRSLDQRLMARLSSSQVRQ
jgi:putative hemolysin